jgi:hypothetical protein
VVSAYLGGDIDIIHRSGESKAASGRSSKRPRRTRPLTAKEKK